MKQGKNIEAREYLESVKSSYPGKESDIFNDIDSRLEKVNNKIQSQAKKNSKAKNNASDDN